MSILYPASVPLINDSTFASYAKKQVSDYVNNVLNPDPDVINPIVPLYVTQPSIYNPNSDTAFVSINPLNPRMITSGFYKDLNKDKSVHKTLSKYYFYKIVDKWIYKELLPLLAFVELKSGKPQLIKSLEDYDIQKLSKDTDADIEAKAKYMEEVVLTQDMVRHVLKHICEENRINWYDLNKHEKKIKKVFYNYLLERLKDAIKKYGSA